MKASELVSALRDFFDRDNDDAGNTPAEQLAAAINSQDDADELAGQLDATLGAIE